MSNLLCSGGLLTHPILCLFWFSIYHYLL